MHTISKRSGRSEAMEHVLIVTLPPAILTGLLVKAGVLVHLEDSGYNYQRPSSLRSMFWLFFFVMQIIRV